MHQVLISSPVKTICLIICDLGHVMRSAVDMCTEEQTHSMLMSRPVVQVSIL